MLDRTAVKVIGTEIDAAIDAVLAKHGMERKPHRVTFNEAGFKYSTECSVVTLNDNGVNVTSPEAQEWLLYASSRGFSDREKATAVLGTTFTSAGRTFTFLGFNGKARKRPLVARGDDGKTYVFPETALRSLSGYDPESDYVNGSRGALVQTAPPRV